jgi:hypothetical protein
MSMLELRRLSNLCGQGAQRAVAAVMRAQRTANEPTLSPLILGVLNWWRQDKWSLCVMVYWIGRNDLSLAGPGGSGHQ